MLEIDGSQKSGSGTILRMSVALAGILGESLHVFNIRKKRAEPGLKPQHLEAVLTAAKLCNADLKGAYIGSQEIWFEPGENRGGEIRAEIGTAGSIPMLIMTVLPICAFAKQPVSLMISKGGTDVRNSPTINYFPHVFFPVLRRMGLDTSIEIHKYGYYPKGMGEVLLKVHPCKELSPLTLNEFGEERQVKGVSVCTFLAERKVAERQAKQAESILRAEGHDAQVKIINDFSNPLQKGSSIVVWVETSSGAVLGSDAIGELGKPSEDVGREAAEDLLNEIESKATVDTHLADILVPYVALAKGKSEYSARAFSEHLGANTWLAQEILGTDFSVEKKGELYQVMKK